MTKQKNKCARCGRNDVKLYRQYGLFLRKKRVLCKGDSAPLDGWSVPLIEDTDGSVWGYSSVPPDAIKRFNAMPEGKGRIRTATIWIQRALFACAAIGAVALIVVLALD